MKLKTWIDYSDEVEIDVPMDQLLQALTDSEESHSLPAFMQVMNKFGAFFNNVTDEHLDTCESGHLKITRDYLIKTLGTVDSAIARAEEKKDRNITDKNIKKEVGV